MTLQFPRPGPLQQPVLQVRRRLDLTRYVTTKMLSIKKELAVTVSQDA